MLEYLASSQIPKLYQNDIKILEMNQELESDCDNNKIDINNFDDDCIYLNSIYPDGDFELEGKKR